LGFVEFVLEILLTKENYQGLKRLLGEERELKI